MKLLKHGDRIIYRVPTGSVLAAFLLVPFGLGVSGFVGLLRERSEPDLILLIPYGLSLGLILLGLVGWVQILRRSQSKRFIKTMIFDRAAGRLYLSNQAWSGRTDLDTLPSYGFGQFVEWTLRSYTTTSGDGNRTTGRTTHYVVSLTKTDGGYFDVLETGFEPRAEAILKQFAQEIPLGPTLKEAPACPLPIAVARKETVQGHTYTWNKVFRAGSYLQALLIEAVVAGGFLFVLWEAQGEIADQMRFFFGALLVVAWLVTLTLAALNARKAVSTLEFVHFTKGRLESGEVSRNDEARQNRRVTQSLDLLQTVAIRFDRRAKPTQGVVFTLHQGPMDPGLLIELGGLTELDGVILERIFEEEVRRWGGQSV